MLLKPVFFIIGLLITYGSLYPFNFYSAPAGAWEMFLASWRAFTGRGDALSNILLFVPFGYFGVLAFGRKAWLMGAALLLAVGVQVVQVYLPGRDANLQDVLWNVLGTAFGAGLTLLPWLRFSIRGNGRDRGLSAPLLLVGCWLGYRLMPFVPSFDWQQWKDSLKPLLLHPQLSWTGLLHDTVAWAVVACLWPQIGRCRKAGLWLLLLIGCWLAYRLMPFVPSLDWQLWKDSLKPLLLHPQLSLTGLLHDAVAWAVVACLWSQVCRYRKAGLWLLLLAGGVFALEVLIVKNTVSATNVLGALLGVGLWTLWLGRGSSGRVILALLLMLSLLLSGLAPFQLRPVPGDFHWLPFHGFLGGSMMINISVVFEKGYFYGALILLLYQESGRFRFAAVTTFLLTLLIEIAQLFVYGHTAEITDPLLVLLIAMALKAVGGESLPRRIRRFTEEK